MRHLRVIIFILSSVLFGVPGLAQQNTGEPASPGSDTTIEQLKRLLTQQDQIILNLERRVEALERQGKTAPPPVEPAPNTQGLATHLVPTTAKTSSEILDAEERTARATLDQTLISNGSLLLPRWTVEVENSVTYYNATSTNLNINGFAILPVLVIGDIESTRVQRQILLANLTTRLGLPKDYQLEVRVPYGYEIQSNVTDTNVQTNNRTAGIGDIEVALYKQLYHQRKGWPDILTGFRWKSTTGKDPYAVGLTVPTLGNGFNGFQTSLTLAKTNDPAVFFGGVTYTYNLGDSKGIQTTNSDGSTSVTPGRVNPGNTIGFSLGTALALNSQASFLVGYQQNFTRSSQLNGVVIPGSYLNTALLQFGAAYMYTKGRTIDLTIGVGLTRDSPDFQFTTALPFRFSLKRPPRLATDASKQSQTTPPSSAASGGQAEVKQD